MPLTATLDAAWASVKLAVDLSAVSSPWFVTVTRTNNVTGETAKVRSGDMVCAGGGLGLVYDHEPPLGVSCTYSAQAFTAVGAATGSPATATVTTTSVTPAKAWVKCLDNPALSRSLYVSKIGFLGQEERQQTLRPLLRTNAVVQSFGLSGREGPFSVQGLSWADIDGLEALKLQASPLLLSFAPELHVRDLYCRAGKWSPSVTGPRQSQTQEWTTGVTEIDRPSTAGVPLRIPGVSWASMAAQFASYTALAAARTNWSDVADG